MTRSSNALLRRLVLVALVLLSLGASADKGSFPFTGPQLRPWQAACNQLYRAVGRPGPFQISGTAQELLDKSGIRLVGQIGQGGMGTVHQGVARGRDGVERYVIVKEAIQRANAVQALRDEYAALEKIRPGKALLLEGQDGSLLLVGELFAVNPAQPDTPAPSLEDVLFQRKDPRFAAGATRDLAFIDEVALALVRELQPVHAAGYVHADMKPANVLLANDTPVLIDFGIAVPVGHQNQNGRVRGTLSYMDPGALMNDAASQSRDVFATQRVLERLYFRDAYDMIDEPNAKNVIERNFQPGVRWRELLLTPETGAEGVTPEVAWVIRSRAFSDVATFERMLKFAQMTRSMDHFLAEYRKVWEDKWKNAESWRKPEMLMELLAKPLYGPKFYQSLDPAIRRELRQMALQQEAKRAQPSSAWRPIFGYHSQLDPGWLLVLPR